jgi:phage baseplate assembly protein W
MKNYSIKFPLEVVPGRETFATIDESEISELIKFNIKSTLLTCPGERRDDLEFGVCAKKYLFDFFSSSETGNLRSAILNQLNEYVPYCFIESVDVQAPEDDPNSLKITVRYEITDIGKKDIFELLLSN